MFCSNCGHPLGEGAKFCPNCGTPVPADEVPVTEPTPEQPEAPAQEPVLVVEPSPTAEPAGEPTLTLDGFDAPRAPEPPVVETTPTTPPPPVHNDDAGTPPSGNGPSQDTLILALRIVCGALGAVFAYFTLSHSFSLIGSVFGYIGNLSNVFLGYYPRGIFGWLVTFILSLVLNVVQVAPPLVAACVLLLAAFKWEEKHNDLVLGGMALATVLRAVVLVLTVLVSAVFRLLIPYYGIVGGAYIGKSLLYILGYAAAAGGVFALMYVVGCPPVMGETTEQVKAKILASINELIGKIQEVADGMAQKAAAKNSGAAPAPSASPAAGTYSPQLKKINRSLLAYILLNIITCGIYSWFFIHGLAKDANDVCDGDGQKTGGLLAFILLGMITCGIYQLIWWYKLCNRMASNAPRYGLVFQENGTTYLMWQLFGVLLCGIGPFIALHIAIKNMNTLCAAYNQRNGFYTTPGAQV